MSPKVYQISENKMVLLPVRLSFGFLVSLCLVSGSGGRPVEPFKLELFKFPLKLSNITFHNCGKSCNEIIVCCLLVYFLVEILDPCQWY